MKAAEFKKEFDKLSTKYFGEGDRYKFYSRKQWDEDRGEKYGTGAQLNCVIEESGWYMVLNGYEGPASAHTELVALGEKYGVWFELGYAWSLHWYPI